MPTHSRPGRSRERTPTRPPISRTAGSTAFGLSLLDVFAVEPVAAQSPGAAFCGTAIADAIKNLFTIIHRVKEEAEKLADWFGLSEREVNWVRRAKAGNDEDGYSEALLGIDEEGWFPLRIRSSDFEAEVISRGITDADADPVKPPRYENSESSVHSNHTANG